MSLFCTFHKTGIFVFVKNAADSQGAYFTLHHRSEIFGRKQAPAAPVEHKNRHLFAGDRLHAVEHAGNIIIFGQIAVVNIAVAMVIGHA